MRRGPGWLASVALLGVNCMKLLAVKVVTGAPHTVWLNTFDIWSWNSGRHRPTWIPLNTDRSTFQRLGRRKKFRPVLPKPATVAPVGCEKLATG